MKLYFDLDEPKCHYRVVGLYEAGSALANDYGSPAELEPLRADAAKRGFDGVVGVRCAAPGTVGSANGRCTGKGYVCE